jgi:hypothetical protein
MPAGSAHLTDRLLHGNRPDQVPAEQRRSGGGAQARQRSQRRAPLGTPRRRCGGPCSTRRRHDPERGRAGLEPERVLQWQTRMLTR